MIMVGYLNYSPDKDKMIREFKFFHGITIESDGIQMIIRTLRERLENEMVENNNIEFIRLMNEISEEIVGENEENLVNLPNTNNLTIITNGNLGL